MAPPAFREEDFAWSPRPPTPPGSLRLNYGELGVGVPRPDQPPAFQEEERGSRIGGRGQGPAKLEEERDPGSEAGGRGPHGQ